MRGLLNFNECALQIGEVGARDLQVSRNNRSLLQIGRPVVEGREIQKQRDAQERNQEAAGATLRHVKAGPEVPPRPQQHVPAMGETSISHAQPLPPVPSPNPVDPAKRRYQ